MRKNASAAMTTACVVLLVFTVARQPATGQRRWDPNTPKLPMAKTWVAYKATLPPFDPPRTPDGVADLQGQWSGPGGGAGDDIEEHEYVDITTPPQESFVADPRDGKIPYTPWALAKRNEIRAGLSRRWPGESGERLYADPASYCLSTIGPLHQCDRNPFRLSGRCRNSYNPSLSPFFEELTAATPCAQSSSAPAETTDRLRSPFHEN